MFNKYIILKGTAGLGNRLITLSNAIEYAHRSNRILYVDWSDGQFGLKGENVFYKYFQLEGIPHILSLDEIPNISPNNSYPAIWGEFPKNRLYDLYIQEGSKNLRKLQGFINKGSLTKLSHGYWKYKEGKNCNASYSDSDAIKSVFCKNDIPFGGNYKLNLKEDIIFYADFCPEVFPEYIRKNIKPQKQIMDEISALATQYKIGKNTIGVHIRMTDKQPDNELQKIVEIVKQINLKNAKLFLATDNYSVIDELKKHFCNIITLPKTQVDLPHGIGLHQYAIRTGDYKHVHKQFKESILDMWLLSQCQYLITQSNSSFSRISQYIKNEPTNTKTW